MIRDSHHPSVEGNTVTEDRDLSLIDDRTLRLLSYHPRAEAAIDYVRSNLGERIRLEHIATLAGMHPAAFSRYFADSIGSPFFALVRMIRIARAIEELRRRECSVSELASLAGYESAYAFSRAFKCVIGQTPSEYRRRLIRAL
jgi:AraC-like DNA-binding protein